VLPRTVHCRFLSVSVVVVDKVEFLSPSLFNRYACDMIAKLSMSRIGCNIGGLSVNILTYADDVVLLAPSWRALQQLIEIMECGVAVIYVVCNTSRTVCKAFLPLDKRKIVATSFLPLALNNVSLHYVSEFKYLGHIISNKMSDDKDIMREIRNSFFCTNLLARRSAACSIDVKIALFRSSCLCFYGIALWSLYNKSIYNRMKSCYNKCMKSSFSFCKYPSVTSMLLAVQLPSFDTVMFNSRISLTNDLRSSCNNIIKHVCLILNV